MKTRDESPATAIRRSDPSLFRLHVLRLLYLMLLVMLGKDVWPVLLQSSAPLKGVEGVAYSFWAALSMLGILGIVQPLRMLPVLVLQFLYKVIWISTVGLPLRRHGLSTGQLSGLETAMYSGVLIDLLVIPWPYVIRHYILTPGERWRSVDPGTNSRG